MEPTGRSDMGVAFCFAAFVLVLGLAALAERVGAPDAAIRIGLASFALLGFCAIGLVFRTMRISRFFAAGRTIGSAHAGMAAAAVLVGLAAPFAPPAPSPYASARFFEGWGAGAVIAAFACGPLLRKTGAFSVSDFLAARFPGVSFRLAAAVTAAAACCLIGFAGMAMAIAVLQTVGQFSRGTAAALTAATLALMIAPGGVSGAVWQGVAAALVALLALCAPLLLIFVADQGQIAPGADVSTLAQSFETILTWSDWGGATTGWTVAEGTSAAGIALGVGALTPVLAPAICALSAKGAVRAGFSTLGWCAAIMLAGGAVAAACALSLVDSCVGRRPDQLPPMVYAASASGLATICGAKAGDAQTASRLCQERGIEGGLRVTDIRPAGAFLLTGLPQLAGLSGSQTTLSWMGLLVLALALSAFAFHGAAAALANDAYYRARDRGALTSRRLAFMRLFAMWTIGAGALTLSRASADPCKLAMLGLSLSCAGVAPVLALALWPRASSSHALFALFVGVGALSYGVLAFGAEAAGRTIVWGLGRDVGQIAGLSALLALAAGLLASLAFRGTNDFPINFIDALKNGEGDILRPDKGA